MMIAQFLILVVSIAMSTNTNVDAEGANALAWMLYSMMDAMRVACRQMDIKFMMTSSVLCGVGELYAGDLDNIIPAIIYILVHQVWNWY